MKSNAGFDGPAEWKWQSQPEFEFAVGEVSSFKECENIQNILTSAIQTQTSARGGRGLPLGVARIAQMHSSSEQFLGVL